MHRLGFRKGTMSKNVFKGLNKRRHTLAGFLYQGKVKRERYGRLLRLIKPLPATGWRVRQLDMLNRSKNRSEAMKI